MPRAPCPVPKYRYAMNDISETTAQGCVGSQQAGDRRVACPQTQSDMGMGSSAVSFNEAIWEEMFLSAND